jgi:LysM repeat protein
MIKRFALLASLLALSFWVDGQTKNPIFVQYIDKYKSLAIDQQRKHKVPAAITIAQGLLESAAGTSELAKSSNNHFGIKCTSDWKGKTVSADDDKADECFRRYADVSDSYEDHSLFLLRPRYESLFALPIGDYKSWAHGLKACGYATDPSYPEKLIRLIELYDLQKLTFDKSLVGAGFVKQSDTTWVDTESDVIAHAAMGGVSDYVYPPMEDLELYNNHPSGYRNGVRYVIAAEGETYASLALYLRMREKTLRKYNDALDTRELESGDMVYIYPKKNRAGRKYSYYYFRPGDDAWKIAQKYGIKLKSLYKLNGIPYGTPLKTQQRLKLR